MATIMTNYTTYDMAYYYRDTKRLPRLCKEEERQLVASLAAPTTPSLPAQQITQVKQRLIEGHLGLATCIAAGLCPRRCRDLYPDLVQEANLALIQATNRCDYSGSGNFTAYVAAWMRGRVKLDSLEAPSQTTTPVCDPQKHEQVEALLSYLSPRAQTILRLRYGLVEGDACPHTEQEIARALGISCDLVHTTAYDAMLRLRALVRGQAIISQRNGKPCISLPGGHPLRLSSEREATLLHACQRIETEGKTVTVRLLVQETGLPWNMVAAFLQQLRGKTATSAQVERQGRLHRLEAAYARLEAAGKRPSERVLAREAEVDKMTALRFLREQHAELTLSRQAEQHARRARLEAAYRRLEAAGKPFSGRALAREAQVALSTAQHFLRKPVACHA